MHMIYNYQAAESRSAGRIKNYYIIRKKRTTTSRSAGRHHAQPHGGKLRAALQSKFRSGRGHGWIPDGGGGSDGKT
jgi:hypothetical protein